MDISNLYIFEWLSKQEISYFLLMAQIKKFKRWSVIISEWERSDDMAYIIKSWSVNVFMKGKQIATINEGDIFWELALIANEPRIATVKAAEDLEVMVFIKEDFMMLYKESWKYEDIKRKILNRIKSNFYNEKNKII